MDGGKGKNTISENINTLKYYFNDHENSINGIKCLINGPFCKTYKWPIIAMHANQDARGKTLWILMRGPSVKAVTGVVVFCHTSHLFWSRASLWGQTWIHVYTNRIFLYINCTYCITIILEKILKEFSYIFIF